MATPTQNETHVLDYLDAIQRGDRSRAYDAFHEDATWTTVPTLPWPSVFHGRKAIFEEYFVVDQELFTTGVSNYDLETLNVVAAGECVVVEMRHRAEGLNGKRYETDHCVVFELRDNRIQAVREYVDSLYLKQEMLS